MPVGLPGCQAASAPAAAVVSSALKRNGEWYQTLKCLGQAVITCASTGTVDGHTTDTRARNAT